MKFAEMNTRQQKAFRNIKYAADDLLGGLENTLLDYNETDDEYIRAEQLLSSHSELVNQLYKRATTELYGPGFCAFGEEAQLAIRDINFCGKEWLMERCEKRITKEGY